MYHQILTKRAGFYVRPMGLLSFSKLWSSRVYLLSLPSTSFIFCIASCAICWTQNLKGLEKTLLSSSVVCIVVCPWTRQYPNPDLPHPSSMLFHLSTAQSCDLWAPQLRKMPPNWLSFQQQRAFQPIANRPTVWFVESRKALKEESNEIVLINSNPAIIMTDPEVFLNITHIKISPDPDFLSQIWQFLLQNILLHLVTLLFSNILSVCNLYI